MSYPCKLYIEDNFSKPPLLVANGSFEESIKLHHGIPIPIGLGVVSITKPILGDARLPLVETSCQTVKLAVGMLILWPRRLIVVESMGESEPKNLCPKFIPTPKSLQIPKPPTIDNTKSTINSPKKNLTHTPSKVDVVDMPPMVKILYEKLSTHNKQSTYSFPTTKEVFGIGKLIMLVWVDFEDLWRCEMVNQGLMSLYVV